mgnify:CR=1 FL=1
MSDAWDKGRVWQPARPLNVPTCIILGDLSSPAKSVELSLPDGRVLTCRIRRHPGYRSMRITVRAGGQVMLSAPQRVSNRMLASFLKANSGWIMERVPAGRTLRAPNLLELTALGERWRIAYGPGRRASADAGVLLLPSDGWDEPAMRALRAWLVGRARSELGRVLERHSRETGLPYSRVSIRGQATRWGSYSSRGTVSLNYRLLFLEPELVTYVLLHELCHSRHMDHSAAFWALLQRVLPDTPRLRARLRSATRELPDWLELLA